MSAPAAMSLPPGRVVLNWWQSLAGVSPRRLCFGHLILHQVEVLAECAEGRPLEPLAVGLWARLARRGGAAPFDALASETLVDPHLLHAALNDLSGRGLATTGADGWRAAGDDPAAAPVPTAQKRRTFPFVDSRPPVYLPVPAGLTTPLPPPPGWRFDLAALRACLAESAEWKQRHGFPADVLRLVEPAADWRTVAVDEPGQALVLFALTAGEALAYSVRPDTWAMSAAPAFACPEGVVSGLGGEPGADAWREAFRSWSQHKSLPGGEVEQSRLEPSGHRLVVRAPAKLVERLKAAKSEALRGEAWVLAGGGRVRAAAALEFVAE